MTQLPKNSVRVLLQVAVLCFMSGKTQAMSATSYEEAVRVAESVRPERLLARTAIDSYFQGMAEALTYLQTDSGKVYFQDRPLLCLPPSVEITGALLRAVIDAELRNPDTPLQRALGADWKKHQVAALTLPALQRVFPCKK